VKIIRNTQGIPEGALAEAELIFQAKPARSLG